MTYRSTSKNKVFTIILLALLILQGGVFGAVNAVEPLRISNVEVTTTDKTATITWYTNQASDGMIEYEYHEDFNPNTDDYRFHLQSGEPNSTMHEITLYSLVPETEYHFRIVSRNSLAEVKSFDQVFETEELGDNSAPNITRVQAAYVTGTTATIQWETDELANSVVEYGSTTSYGSTRSDGARLILHDITITGLQPGNTYHFRVKSTDNKDNTSISPDRSFRTDITQGGEKETLYITGLTPVSSNDPDVTETSAKISYRTNKLANCKVSYGTSTSFRHSKSCPKPRNFLHEVTINDLNPNTRYYYEVESVDVFGVRITSATNSFTTRGGEPAINNLIIENNVAESEIFFYVSYDTTVHADRASGNSRAIINNNSYLTNQNSISGQSLVIDNNSNVAYESHNNINNERGTIAFWFRPNWNGNDNIGHTLFDFSTGEDNSVDSNYFMLDKDKNNNFRFWLENSSDNDFQKITYNASSIRANQWYHIAITYDYANGIADFYLDGQKVASDKPHGTPFTFNKYFYIGPCY